MGHGGKENQAKRKINTRKGKRRIGVKEGDLFCSRWQEGGGGSGGQRGKEDGGKR